MLTNFLEGGSSLNESSLGIHDSEDAIEQLEPPMFTVGKSDAVIHVLPTALRFWEKLGLGPRGGKKHVTAFVLFEDDGEERQRQVHRWLSNISATYTVSHDILYIELEAQPPVQALHFGCHTAGHATSCPKAGVVPLNFDSFRKNLGELFETLC